MNTNDSSPLIDESEIRAALSVVPIDRDAFGHGVRERVKQAVVRPTRTDGTSLEDRGDLLRVAASVLPVNVLGANVTATPTSLSAVGVFQKAIGYLALPAVSMLMIAVTVNSWFRIRRAQRTQSHPEADMARTEESLLGWWRRYRWIATIVFVLSLALPFLGWTTPLLLVFMASAIGTASIITTLGKAGLVDRDVVGGICNQVLGNLGGVAMIFAITNNTQLLDPYLTIATFYAGSTFLLFFVNAGPYGFDAKHKESRRKNFRFLAGCVCVLLTLLLLSFIVPTPQSVIFESIIKFTRFALIGLAVAILVGGLILGGLIVWYSNRWPSDRIVVRGLFLVLSAGITAFFGQTLWWPIGTSALVQQAETFEPGHWPHWQATARYLQDQGIEFDQSAVQTRWQGAFDEEGADRSAMLNHVVSTGLKFPSELIETKKFKANTRRLLSTGLAGTPISRINEDEYIIAMLAEEGALTNEQRDHLAGRLLATWRSLNDDRIQESLVDATIITNLLSLIDRPLAEAERKADVVRWLGEYQALDNRLFAIYGGFRRYVNPESGFPANGDLLSTEHAVRLMQLYGTHDSVDVLALRAFLRPALSDRIVMDHASVRASTRQRLDQIPGIPQPSLWDYFRLNQSLWFAMLLVGLCIYATLGSPRILKEANEQK